MSTRPSRNAPPPPPAANALYCHTCGRVITQRKPHLSTTTTTTPQKYCSDRCRRSKPRPDATGTSLETLIESTFVRLLGVGDRSEGKVVECGEVEREVFSGRDGAGGDIDEEEMKADVDVGNDDDDDNEGGGVPLPSTSTATSTISALPTTQGKSLSSQQRGIRKAKEREMVRQAARRGVAFGFEIEGARRKVDCVREGRVVESSFAKGEWGVRWRG